MRFVTWNCAVGNFKGKASAMAPLKPDVLAVQEVESLDGVLLLAGAHQPTYRARHAPTEAGRAVGVFSYTGVDLEPVATQPPDYSFCRYLAKHGASEFQVIAVWTWDTGESATKYKQVHTGVERHAEWIRSRPTVILGDFNNNQTYDGGKWQTLAAALGDLGLVSAYHEFFSEPYGGETQYTYFHHRDPARPFHIDYCFIPMVWRDRIRQVEVGRHEDWRDFSDHMPLIVDIDV